MDYAAYTPRQLGQVLRGQRKSQQLTQKDAAKMVGLLPKTVSKMELATETATIESLFKLLSALQLELVVRSRSSDAQTREW
jgi:HTH-type transcriptional regulator/antitoxin HipB